LQLKETINTMVDQLNAFASEVTRVAREVGTEGKLGGQAVVPEVAGTWKDLTDNVNSMASNLTGQVRNIAEVTKAVAEGDLSKKITVDVRGEILQLKEAINTMVDQLRSFASEVTRVAREVGTEGKLGGQAYVQGVAGTWKDLTDNVNSMASNLTGQVRNIAAVTTALARGDLSKKITVDVKGEIQELKDTINTMVDQLNAFASEVTRVAREVGTEGKLGGQAQVTGVSGTWKDLTDNVNSMASNLTSQVRGIATVVTAVANGNLSQKLTVAAEGEIAALAETINNMIQTLATFASQVTNVAREVGVEGRLGGQSNVPGAAGTWKDLTENVNQLAANLTTQVRAIAEVATAVTQGDLTRSINVEARGEVETLKDTINQMIANLRATTQKNADQDWLKTNLALFTRMLQGQKDPQAVSKAILSELSRVISAQHGVFYIAAGGEEEEAKTLKLLSSFAYSPAPGAAAEFGFGEGLVGECAVQKSSMLLNPAPEGYVQVTSGLGRAQPHSIVILPALFEGRVKAVLELASFSNFNATHLAFLEQLMESIGIVLHTLEASLRTETLLKHLQSQQEELRKANQELEEKADQLARTSRFKSEFLSKMSHELRTPLNSMLILSQRLLEDAKSLTPKQLEYCKTIHTSGGDLLVLINDILDLSKVESGALSLDLEHLPFSGLGEPLERIFGHVASSKGLEFSIDLAADLPKSLYTDGKRLEQILRNLLSNAFKFTEKGRVTLKVERVHADWKLQHPELGEAQEAVAFAVSDTGIGIAADKQKIIFEAFQQAESGTSRKYGGTGLGLSISSELAKLLGGQLSLVASQSGEGSTFALYLPLQPPTREGAPEGGDGEREEPPLFIFDGRNGAGSGSAAGEALDSVDLSGRRVLVVDDDIRNIFAMTSLLEYHGIKVLPAESGAEALRALEQGQPVDGVLMDIMMPEMDGYDTIRAIRAMPGAQELPIIAVTAKAMKEDRQKCLEAGATDYITKPVNSQRMIAMLHRLLKG
jgi:signal transduction histidine kinase/HAMP domain-containing protein